MDVDIHNVVKIEKRDDALLTATGKPFMISTLTITTATGTEANIRIYSDELVTIKDIK